MPLTLPFIATAPIVPTGTVYFVRHGLVHNPNRIAYGWAPRYRLADEGVRQANATARFLAGTNATAIFTSPLLRARQTTRVIAAVLPSLPVRRMNLLIESGLARHWEGIPWHTLETEHAEVYGAWRASASRFELGESMAAMARRMQAAMAKALRRTGGTPAICVSHRDPILAMRLAAEGGSFDELHTTPCNPASVTIVRSNDGQLTMEDYVEPFRA